MIYFEARVSIRPPIYQSNRSHLGHFEFLPSGDIADGGTHGANGWRSQYPKPAITNKNNITHSI
jgi:hypothetical protein